MTDEQRAVKTKQCRELLAANERDTLDVERRLHCQISRALRLQELRVEREVLEVELMHLTGVYPGQPAAVVAEAPAFPRNRPEEGGDDPREKEPANV